MISTAFDRTRHMRTLTLKCVSGPGNNPWRIDRNGPRLASKTMPTRGNLPISALLGAPALD
jgi:hypothetical protein